MRNPCCFWCDTNGLNFTGPWLGDMSLDPSLTTVRSQNASTEQKKKKKFKKERTQGPDKQKTYLQLLHFLSDYHDITVVFQKCKVITGREEEKIHIFDKLADVPFILNPFFSPICLSSSPPPSLSVCTEWWYCGRAVKGKPSTIASFPRVSTSDPLILTGGTLL